VAYLGFAEQEVEPIRRRKRNDLLRKAASAAKERSGQRRPARDVVRAEIGGVWSKRAKRRASGYLSLKLDDGTFNH
jgi:uncharacterized protein (DUF736 family)